MGAGTTLNGKLLLIEATPAIEEQLALLHRLAGGAPHGRAPVDGVLVTHAHIGHYLGLAHFGREVCATQGLPLWVSPRMAGFLREHGPWKQLVQLGQIDVREVAPGSTFSPIEGVSIEAIAVPHRDEFSDTLAFKVRGPGRCVLFVPDVDAWSKHPGLLERLLEGVDVAYLDGTFYDGSELPERARRDPASADGRHDGTAAGMGGESARRRALHSPEPQQPRVHRRHPRAGLSRGRGGRKRRSVNRRPSLLSALRRCAPGQAQAQSTPASRSPRPAARSAERGSSTNPDLAATGTTRG